MIPLLVNPYVWDAMFCDTDLYLSHGEMGPTIIIENVYRTQINSYLELLVVN